MKPNTLSLILFALLARFAVSPNTQAVVPPPDGGYPNFTTAAGDHALQALTLGVGNTAIGTFSLFSVTTGNFNTAVGSGALDLNLGDFNTATGAAALLFNTTGTENTAQGTAALEFNETGSHNTANGAFALFSNATGSSNSAFGFSALQSTTGVENTGTGSTALFTNTTGDHNTANGSAALYSNTTGDDNTAVGFNAIFSNTTGINNTAMGRFALGNNIGGSNNIAVGDNAGTSITNADNVICIGHPGANVNSSCYIGNIFGAGAISGDQVFITSAGKLGTVTIPSAARFKEEIEPMNEASDVIFALKPVTFRYKEEFDPQRIPQFGLVAEEVEKVNPDLVKRDHDGKLQTVRYDAVNAMLLNEFLKEHRKVDEQDATIIQQRKDFETAIARLQTQVEALTAGLQRVSAQLAAANGAAGIRSDIDGSSREADVSGSEQVNPSLADSN